MKMSIGQIAEAAGSTYLAVPCSADENITSMTWDSRAVQPGGMYVALPGERVDGNDFIADAIGAGARAVLTMREPGESHVRAATEAGAAIMLVDECLAALGKVAAAWRSDLKGRVVGITGSTGKTTTKNLVRDVLAAAGTVVATEENQNNELGVPRTLLAADEDTGSVVVEMGMRGLGQIAELCEVARPDWGLVTNAGESHIELLGSRENIAHAKAELFAALSEGGIAFVNAADEYAGEMCRFAQLGDRGVNIVLFCGSSDWTNLEGQEGIGLDVPCVWAEGISIDEGGRPSFTMHASHFGKLGNPDADGSQNCTMQLRGVHNVSNACSAAAVGLAAGLTLERCCEVLAASQPERGRQQVVRATNGALVVDDAYNANPDSMRASLSTFAAMQVQGRRIAVLGDMLELGDFSKECHERVGSFAAQAGLDRLICVGELSAHIAESAERKGLDAASISRHPDAQGALAEVSELLGPDDAVLVKASHGIGLDHVVEGLVR